ncbi:hypothetical protein [Phaffia rhodozyma]|uniref:Uncharacterized protein n=1 Tax=Phaffia rhodozyma TaxID=264483 RepID=A0A0F7SIA0_PHARH|nr:hypothetical protein [Phaffia rhodozyma]
MLSSKPTRPARSTDPRPPNLSTGSNNLRTTVVNTTPTVYLPPPSAPLVSSRSHAINASSISSPILSSVASTSRGPPPPSRPSSGGISANSFPQDEYTSEKTRSEPSSDPLDAFPSTNRSNLATRSLPSSSPPSRQVSRANSPVQISLIRPKAAGTSPATKLLKLSDVSLSQPNRSNITAMSSGATTPSCSMCVSSKQSPANSPPEGTLSTPHVQPKRITVRAPKLVEDKREGVNHKKRQISLASTSSSASLVESIANKTKRTTPSDARTANSPDKGRKRLQLITAQANSFSSPSSSSSSSMALSASPSYVVSNKSHASSSKPIKLRAPLPLTQKRDAPVPIPIPIPVSVPVPIPIPIPIPIPTATPISSSELETNRPLLNLNKRPLDDKSENDRPGKKRKEDRTVEGLSTEKKKRKKDKRKNRESKVGPEAEVRNKVVGENKTGAGTGTGKKIVLKKKTVEPKSLEQEVRSSQVVIDLPNNEILPNGVPIVPNRTNSSNSEPPPPQTSPPQSQSATPRPSVPQSRPSSETRLETSLTIYSISSNSSPKTNPSAAVSTSIPDQRPVHQASVMDCDNPDDNVVEKEQKLDTSDTGQREMKKSQGRKKEVSSVSPLTLSNDDPSVKLKPAATVTATIAGETMATAMKKLPLLVVQPFEVPSSLPLEQIAASPAPASSSSLPSIPLQASSSAARVTRESILSLSSTSSAGSASALPVYVASVSTPSDVQTALSASMELPSRVLDTSSEANSTKKDEEEMHQQEVVFKEETNLPKLVANSSSESISIDKPVLQKPSSIPAPVIPFISVSALMPTLTPALSSELEANQPQPQPKLVESIIPVLTPVSTPISTPKLELSRSSSVSTPTSLLLPLPSESSSRHTPPSPGSRSRSALSEMFLPHEQNILFDTTLSDSDESIAEFNSPIEIFDSDSDSNETASSAHKHSNRPRAIGGSLPTQPLSFEALVMLSTSEEGEPALAIVQIFNEPGISNMFYMLCKNCDSDDSFLCSRDDLQEAEFDESHRRMSWIFAMEDHSITFLENAMWKAFLDAFDRRLRTNSPALPLQILPEPPSVLPEKVKQLPISNRAPPDPIIVPAPSALSPAPSFPPSPNSEILQVQKQIPLLSCLLPPLVAPSPSLVEQGSKLQAAKLVSPSRAPLKDSLSVKANKLSRMTSSRSSYTINIQSCSLGSGRNDKFKLPKFCAISVKAQMANSPSYEDAQTIKQTTYYSRLRFEGPRKKSATFEPPLEFNLPPETFRVLPSDWPFMFDQGLRQDTHLRLEIQFLSFTANHRKPCEWILSELAPFNQGKPTIQLPGCLIELVRPRGAERDYLDLPGTQLPLTIRGSVVLPKMTWGLECANSWNSTDTVQAQKSLKPSSTSNSSSSKTKATPVYWATRSVRGHTPKATVPGVIVQPATDSPIKRNKSRVIKDDSESDTDFIDGASLTTGTSSDGGGQAHHERGTSSDADENYVKVPQPFTMVFNPDGPTFKPSPPRAPLPLNQRIWKGSLANNLTALDRGIRDPEIFEREEAIFDLEAIHDGQKFMMCLWNRWVDSYGRIQPWNSHGHIIGFVTRYFSTIDSANVRRYLVLHLETLSAFDLCNNATFAEALALYASLKRNAVRTGILKKNGR